MGLPRCTAAALAVAALLVLLAPAVAAAETGRLEISSDPPGASVFVNGTRAAGTTPLAVVVPADEPQEVVVNLYGYAVARQTAEVGPGETAVLAFDLEVLAGGAGAVTATPGAVVSATAPGGTAAPTGTAGVWEEEAPLPAGLAVLALGGAALLARRRR